MDEIYNGKTILVTGGTGSIGVEIVKQLLEYNVKQVIIFSRDEIKHFLIKKQILDSRLETVVGDIKDYVSLQRVFNKFNIDLIFHASAMKHVVICEQFPIECVKTNVLGTQNIVDLAIKYHVPKFITISTDKSVSPTNTMGSSKLIAERITLNANYSCVRFGNVANSRGSVIPVFVDNLLARKPINVTDMNVTRFIMEIPDAVKLVLKASKYSAGGDVFLLKMKAFKLEDLVDVFLNRISSRLNISREDVIVNVSGLTYGEKLHEELIHKLESDRLYELDDMYVLLKSVDSCSNYTSIKKSKLDDYSSSSVSMISKDDLELIVMNYLTKIGIL